ncbi:hypothetical protein I8752_14055 [Nostocaceae cyanobacterium CENA369]|uniref:Uncharacterized protein n=1 Tax=Dendronalium phyllosphericum CENA369 TaxID=1725256 RepID=A0A8J7LFH7_9NOST|nr:hypothetical protein [Dendronalium phyllosphericum]MBH8574123.1 hypothetical protein [Dendronalium phyllosphericum CENA369]
MSRINGLEEMIVEQVNKEIANGAKFVTFIYCFSLIILSFKRSSDIYFIKANESSLLKSLPFIFISLFFGWWGIPWGIIYTIQCLFTNLRGGKDMTAQVISALRQT